MNTDRVLTSLVFCVISLAALYAAFKAGRHYQRLQAQLQGQNPGPAPDCSTPRVIVQVPEHFKPLDILPEDTKLEGLAAVLWWTVYKETMDSVGEDASSATEAANAAVESVMKHKGGA